MLDTKSENKHHSEKPSILSSVPKAEDLMATAILLQSRAAEYGFDWPTIEPVFDKLQEEIRELQHEINIAKSGSEKAQDYHQQRLHDELGDILFCCMNLARFLQVDPAKALNSTNDKFERRFRFIESHVALEGKDMMELSLEELDEVWNKAKKAGL